MNKFSTWKFLPLLLGLVVTSLEAQAIESFDLEWMNATEVGSRYKTDNYADAVFVVEAFQLNCGPCRENAPIFDRLARFFSYEPRVQVVDLGIDSARSNFDRWISTVKPEHPVLMDAGRRVWSSLQGAATPTTWVLDCKLNVLWKYVGVLSEVTQRELTALVDKQLEVACVK